MAERVDSGEALDAFLDGAPCGLLLTTDDGLILTANQTFLNWTGYARSELVGRRRFDELLSAPSRIYHETHYAPLLLLNGLLRVSAREEKLALVGASVARGEHGESQ